MGLGHLLSFGAAARLSTLVLMATPSAEKTDVVDEETRHINMANIGFR